MTASIISFKDASTRLSRQAQLRREQERREQELIEAAEAELDKAPVQSERLIIRSLARLRERDAARDRDAP
ncbi:hypothetical protein [Bosea psychrotolerans]|uniref:Uncharacterized protein n=1 Tax=Bosea psychrotolerans TaxID=1871628 RepID=A0A2S4LT10_9HYPH|nr:hypothetical protein [Bosea psychrotolerans]POR45570.1 hypothetical protein CYD53_13228 [Bosea psychrotolerans]